MRCAHCMFWRRVDDPGPELSVDELRKVAATTPPLRTLALTGGEPFLREDLWEIIQTFYETNNTHHIQVDTNGLLGERMAETIVRFIKLKPKKYLSFQVSLDGLAKTHDRLRRTPGSFDRIIENIRTCSKREVDYFRITVLTNVNRENVDEIEPLARLLREIDVPHVYDFVRGTGFSAWDIPASIQVEEDPRDCGLPPVEQLEALVDQIERIDREEGGQFGQWIEQLRWQVELYRGEYIPVPCLSAGRTAGVIYSDGSVTACEFTKPFAHLRDYDFDLARLWAGPEADKRRSQITRCRCTHSCFLLTSHQEWLEQTGQVQPFAPEEGVPIG